jgi:hypothetical protein
MWTCPEWIPGKKHPDTPRTEFMNCWEYDRVRKVIIARCKICNATISRDEKAAKELLFRCVDTACNCGQHITHPVCCLCYDLFHALYANYGMKNRNYFKDMDDKQRQDWNNYKKRENGNT